MSVYDNIKEYLEAHYDAVVEGNNGWFAAWDCRMQHYHIYRDVDLITTTYSMSESRPYLA